MMGVVSEAFAALESEAERGRRTPRPPRERVNRESRGDGSASDARYIASVRERVLLAVALRGQPSVQEIAVMLGLSERPGLDRAPLIAALEGLLRDGLIHPDRSRLGDTPPRAVMYARTFMLTTRVPRLDRTSRMNG